MIFRYWKFAALFWFDEALLLLPTGTILEHWLNYTHLSYKVYMRYILDIYWIYVRVTMGKMTFYSVDYHIGINQIQIL